MLPTTTRSPSPTTSPRRPLPSELTTQIDRFVSDLLQELQPIAHSDNGPATTPRPIRVEPTTPEPGLGAPVDLQAVIEDGCRVKEESDALIAAVRHHLINGSSAPVSPDTDSSGLSEACDALHDLLSRTMALHTSVKHLLTPKDREPASGSDSDSDSDSESSPSEDLSFIDELSTTAAALQDLIGLVELAEQSEPLQSPGSSFLQTMVDERNRLMDSCIVRTAAMPRDSDLPAITRALAELHGMQVRLADLDHRITCLLDPDGVWRESELEPEFRSIIRKLDESADDLARAVRLFEIAELEGQLRERGTRFEHGQLGVMRHDDTVGPFPAKEALRLVQLHAEDGSDAGILVATRLLAAWSHHVTASWDLREVEPTMLEVYVELANTIASRHRFSSTEGAPLPGEADPLYRYRGRLQLQRSLAQDSHNVFGVTDNLITWPHVIETVLSSGLKEDRRPVYALALELKDFIHRRGAKLPQYLQVPASGLNDWISSYESIYGGNYVRTTTADRYLVARSGLSELSQPPILDPSKKNFG